MGLNRAIRFTEVYRKNQNEHPAVREIMCLREQFPQSLQPIEANDLIAGRYKRSLVRFTQHACDELGYCFDEEALRGELNQASTDENLKHTINDMISFWSTERTAAKVRAAYPSEMAAILPSDKWFKEPGISFPLYRMCGAMLDFDTLMQLGIPGMKDVIQKRKQQTETKDGNVKLFDGMLQALDLLSDVCVYYAKQAEQLSSSTSDSVRQQELKEMADNLNHIHNTKPTTFGEAIQLFWLYATVSGVRNYGRMDVFLGDFLVNDLNSGVIDEEKALRYAQSLWRLIAFTHTIFESRVIIGGMGRRNPKNADAFAMLAMEATRTVLEGEPQLSLRWYNGMNEALLEKAMSVIGEGRTYPILYNDDVNVRAVEEAFAIGRTEAEQYVPFGCGEYIIEHRSMGTPSGVINLLKALEVTLHNGIDPITGKRIGISTGEISQISDFEQLLQAYKKQVEHFVEVMAVQEELEYRIVGENAAYLYSSILYDDCIDNGKSLFDGGVRYLGGTLESYGNINTADSLLAIKELIFDKGDYTLEHLVQILDANFEGHDLALNKLKAVAKFGNDHQQADNMTAVVHDHICKTIKIQSERTGLDSYLDVTINNHANTLMGQWTSASADGRKYGQSMSNGNTPSGGSDRKGLTALLNSMASLDPNIHAGVVHNLKCGKELLVEQKEQFKALLKTYFSKGGTQLMVTVVNRNELEQAMIEPDKYTHIFVRVGGFSARFVELSKEVQRDVLNRTLY